MDRIHLSKFRGRYNGWLSVRQAAAAAAAAVGGGAGVPSARSIIAGVHFAKPAHFSFVVAAAVADGEVCGGGRKRIREKALALPSLFKLALRSARADFGGGVWRGNH